MLLSSQAITHAAGHSPATQVKPDSVATELFEEIPSVFDASKYEQKLTKSPPSSMGVVTADEIKKYGYRTFGDIISSLKGFYNTNDRSYGYVGARGFGLPSDYNTRILLLIDGHRFNDNIYDSFDTSEGFPVDVDIIERVEIIRGPSSSLYGTSAFFGVVNIITRRGRDVEGANVKASYGSNDSYKTSVSVGDRFKNGLEAFLTGTFYQSSGNKNLYYKEFDQPETNFGVTENNDAEGARKLMGTLAYQGFTLQGLYVRRNKEIPTASYETLFNHPGEYVADESTFLDLKYEHTFDNQLNLNARVSYNNYRYAGQYPYDYSGSGVPDIVLNKDLSRGQWWRAEFNATKFLWHAHKVTAGAEIQQNFDQFQTNYDRETYTQSADHTQKWALLLQDEYGISSTLTLNTGVRFDYFSIFGSTVNPRAGIVYEPWEGSVVKLLYGMAFRAPNQYELHYSSSTNNQLVSENLKPEKLESLELVLEHHFNQHLRAELDFFHTKINNIILSALTADNALQIQNIGLMHSQGFEIQLEDSWGDGFQGRISYSWQETINNLTHERVVNSPEHMLKLNLIAPLWADKVFAGFEMQYMSRRKTSSGGMVDDYCISNLTLFNQKWFKGVELSVGAYNLFDQHYFDPGSTDVTQNAIERDGATYRIKASMDF